MLRHLIAGRTSAVMLLLVVATSFAIPNGQAESWRVTAYAAGSSDSVAIRTISGTRTGLGHPAGMVVGGGSELLVTNKANNSVTVYARGAGGNVAPRRTISGARTGLIDPRDVALDSSGILYVSNIKNSTITVYEVCRSNCGP
jgi:lactonase family protein with 7-bladed beta-propeller